MQDICPWELHQLCQLKCACVRACVLACAHTPTASERASERSYISSAAASLRQGLRVRGADAEGAGGPPHEGSAASSSFVSVCLDRVLLSACASALGSSPSCPLVLSPRREGGRERDPNALARTHTHTNRARGCSHRSGGLARLDRGQGCSPSLNRASCLFVFRMASVRQRVSEIRCSQEIQLE